MHIPDGYLSPETCAVFGAAMVPAWVVAGRRVGRVVKARSVPLIAIGSAFSFLIMMFNVPIPDGTTAHAVAATLIAILLGPWAAVIAVSIALLIQALFFGDGGVLAFGANAFNMAFVMPMVGYAVYRLLARSTSLTASRRALSAGLAAYVAINVAALIAAIEFGLQPVLFHTANGTPLYAPFHLSQTIPAMMLAHLTVAGFVELTATAGVVRYLQRANVPVLQLNHPDVPLTPSELARRPLGWRWALFPIGVMAVITPLGLLAKGGAFGEAKASQLSLGKYGLNAVPSGLARFNGFWHHAVLGGYGLQGGRHPVVGYLLSALVGIAVVSAVVFAALGLARLVGNLRDRSGRRAHAGSLAAVPASPQASSRTGTPTPEWLVQGEMALCPCGCIGTRKKGSFLEKTIDGASNVMRQALFREDVAAQQGSLQRVDPRAKVLMLLMLLLAAALVRDIPVLVLMYTGTLVLASASRLPLGFFIKRVWLFIPIFTGIIVLPAAFSFITPGHIVVPLWTWDGHTVGLTTQGLTAVGLIVIRVATSVSLVVLVTLTTPWNRLLAGLRALFVPRIFILVIGMAYRYIFLLLNAVTDMYTSRRSRQVGNGDHQEGRRFVAATAGALFGKAHALSDEVHMAMVSRGYRGDAKTLRAIHMGLLDWGSVAAGAAAMVIVIGGDRLLGR